MLLALTYNWRSGVPDEQIKRNRRIFIAWDPPSGIELLTHYYYADGGGLMILRAVGAADLFESLAPSLSTVAYEVHPALT